MKSFAYLVNPLTIEELKDSWLPARILPEFLFKVIFKGPKPIKVSHGFLILCPLLAKPPAKLEEEFILGQIIQAGRIAEGLGAKILGLSGYASLITDAHNRLAKNLKIPVTSGNSYASWSVFEAIYRLAKAKDIDLKKSRLAIIGAANSIGSLCARKLSSHVNNITIFDNETDKIELLREAILELNPIAVIIAEDERRAIENADIVVHIKAEGPLAEVKHNQDTLTIKAGLVKSPEGKIISSWLAEVMLLALEERFVNYSLLGQANNLDKLEEIADIAARQGFEVWVPEAPLQ